MVKINLLPYVEKKAMDSAVRQLIIAGSAIAGFLLLIGAVHVYLVMDVGSLEEKIKSESERLAILTKTAGEITQVNFDKKAVQKKLEIIKTLEENRIKPVILLDEMTLTVPAGQVWLTNFAGAGGSLKIEGIAKDNVSIARFMKNLEKTSSLTSVDLVNSKQTVIANSKLQAFTLSCGLKYPPVKPPEADDKAKKTDKGDAKK